MANPKRAKLNEFIKKIPKDKLGKEDLLSHDLPDKVGNLSDKLGDLYTKEKITIRLDARIVNAAKAEAEMLGVSYQKLVNDKLLAAFGIEEKTYLKPSIFDLEKFLKNFENEIDERINHKIEQRLKKKRA
jgi:predicted DNA binding CopG/RHH family protein